jgi:hypothetical protein
MGANKILNMFCPFTNLSLEPEDDFACLDDQQRLRTIRNDQSGRERVPDSSCRSFWIREEDSNARHRIITLQF